MSQNPPQKTHQKQAIGRLGLGVVSLALVAGCTAPGTGGAEESAAPPSASPSAETGATGTTEETQPASTHAIGETVTMGELEHTLHGVRFSQGDEYSAPEAGTRWLVADIEVTNNSDASEAISSVMMWTLNDPDHRSVDMTYTGDERGSLDGELGPGRSMRGEIAYAVSADQTSWELIFSPEAFGFGQAVYEVPAPESPGSSPEPGQTTREPTPPSMPGALPDQNFTYDEAYAAWQDGMPYYDAFCIHYEPTTSGGVSQCEGIENGTVDSITGEYIGG